MTNECSVNIMFLYFPSSSIKPKRMIYFNIDRASIAFKIQKEEVGKKYR